ncbi:conserved hypothetical protein [Alkaliphilus metalliredigens QYMF]|uniref:Uncharacterized protein n=1 Tax=Alkaliphilus metalliredigens (strain QYMF) TaxID=293826 RepID=A6TUC5_ALKMQ|nr:DUF6648 family protein [Alkaliphilus metalliredigens]ABR49793.1 conserved hypothetical protein [Alkaliphilus metalliredigens QYMF]
MKYVPRQNIFKDFFQQREAFIVQYKNGDMTKKEYIEESYFYMKQNDIKPFQKMDSFEKAIYNYQYYNMMAKYCYLQAKEIKKYGKHSEKQREYLQRVNQYYYQKDKSTMAALEVEEFRGVEVYYIRTKSSYLKDQLYEIVFKGHKGVILHSKSAWLRERLEDEQIFSEVIKNSLIENYINEKY